MRYSLALGSGSVEHVELRGLEVERELELIALDRELVVDIDVCNVACLVRIFGLYPSCGLIGELDVVRLLYHIPELEVIHIGNCTVVRAVPG